MRDRKLLELARLKEFLHYDHDTGIFTWIKSKSNVAKVGTQAGKNINNHGYSQIMIDGKQYRCHRLAWFYFYGFWPKGEIDHINCLRNDNRIKNLRDVSKHMNTQNQRTHHINNKCKALGVCKKQNGKFQAEIRNNGKKIYIGTFDTKEAAYEKYAETKRVLHAGSSI